MKLKFAILPLLIGCSAHGASLMTLSNPVADGIINTSGGNNDRSDWDGTTAFPLALDGGFATDFASITFAHDSSKIYIRQQMNSTPSGYFTGDQIIIFDIDQDSTTGYRGPNGSFAIGGEYMLSGNTMLKYTGSDQREWSWTDLGTIPYDDFPTNDHEISFLSSLIESPTSFDFVATTDYYGNGDNYPANLNGGDSGDYFTYAIPEPSSLLSGSVGLFAALSRRNRKP